MPNRVRVLAVRDGDRAELERRARSKAEPARVAQRARIVLLSEQGLTGPQIAERVGCTEPTVISWRARYAESGLAGLDDAPRPGGPVTVMTPEVAAQILADTVTPPPEGLRERGVTHWSARRLAQWLVRHRGIVVSHDSIVRLWRRFCLAPHRSEGFKFSTDPELEAKIRDVVGLYLDPPKGAVVVCVDEKSQIQALDRTQPILPMRPGQVERQTHDYVRHGTTTLFAALEVATGKIVDACMPRHRHQEFLAFLKQVAKAHPRVQLHVVADNYATHKHPTVTAWLAKHRRVHLHFTPTSCSWLNLVECFFSIVTRQAIRRGTFSSVADLTAAIETYIDGWNETAEPFTWTTTADELLDKINQAKTKTSTLTVH
ncbi:MAG: IS630 family transposase [Pseudonocardiaceae bacterium]